MLLLLSEVRKKLLAIWLIFSALLLFFFFFEFNVGKYEGLETAAWLWIFTQILPGLLILLAATFYKTNMGKAILKWAFWAVDGLVAFFLVFVLVSLAGISSGSSGKSLAEGFAESYRFLLPLQILVVGLLAVLFFKKDSIFQPNENILRGHAEKQLADAKSAGQIDRSRALEFFVAAEMPEMLDFLEEKMKAKNAATDRLNDLFLLKNQLKTLRRETDLGTSDERDSRKEYNRICLAALGLVNEI